MACGAAEDGDPDATSSTGVSMSGANTSTLPAAGSSSAGTRGGVAGARSGSAGQAPIRVPATGASGASAETGRAAAAGSSSGAGAGAVSMPGGAAAGGGAPGVPAAPPPLDCGKDGWAIENHGDPKNRVNYVILADGYTAETVETTLKRDIDAAFKRRFEHESGEPYGRYRNFVNICVMKVVSQTDGIGKGPTAFDGGNGGDRLAAVNESKVNAYIKANVPATFEVDWKAVVLNQDKWENTGSYLMLWSGGNEDGPGAALHEGGHGFHQLADEYGSQTGCNNQKASCGSSGDPEAEVNTAGNCMTTDGKWDMWLGTTQKGLKVPDMGATGMQGTWEGSRYVGSGQYRPSCNSMMNSLFGGRDLAKIPLNTSFNSVSREQMIFSIWRAVTPIDSSDPPAGPVTNPAALTVNVVDPAVINVDWTVDGMTTENAGTTFSTASLASGTHMISAKAYDNASMDLVKLRTGACPKAVTGNYCHGTSWPRSTQTVSWTVTKP